MSPIFGGGGAKQGSREKQERAGRSGDGVRVGCERPGKEGTPRCSVRGCRMVSVSPPSAETAAMVTHSWGGREPLYVVV